MQVMWRGLISLPCGVVLLVACSPPRVQTTRLDADDLVAMTDAMVASLLRDPVLAERSAASPLMVVVADRVSNRTNDILPDREKQAFTARLRAMLNVSPAIAARNIQFVQARDRPGPDRVAPTHALAATFHALTVADRDIRSDTYLCAFQLIDLASDRVIWEDAYETKKTVLRNEMD